MDHAEAVERLADHALEPGRLAALDTDPSPDAASLRDHVAACGTCRDELAAWRRSWSMIGIAGRDDESATRAPASLRVATLAAVAAEPRTSSASPMSNGVALPAAPAARSRRWRVSPWLAVAAALVVAVGAAGVGWDRANQLEHLRAENAGLAAATTAMGQVLADRVHWTTSLKAADGTAAGTVAWTAGEIVVVAARLPALPAGSAYRCWVERDGVRTPIGAMAMSGSTGYWSGPMDGWAGLLVAGARFGVSVVSADGSSAPVLVGTL